MKIISILLVATCFITLAYGWCDAGQWQCQPGYIGCEQYDCKCLDGWRSTFPLSGECEPYCGDGQVVPNEEECDGGVGCCDCKCLEGYEPYHPPRTYCQQINPATPNPTGPTTVPSPSTPTCGLTPTGVPTSCGPITPITQNPSPQTPTTVPAPSTPSCGLNPTAAPTSCGPIIPAVNPSPQTPTTVPTPPNPPVSAPLNCFYETYPRGGFSQESCYQGNVRCLLDENFACMTKTPIIVGRNTPTCDYLRFTTTAAISSFIGGQGESQINALGPLTSTAVNPTSSPAGQLAIQLLTAELNIRLFHCIDGDCTGADITDLCFRAGQCNGATVKNVVAAAHFKIAGCDSSVPCGAPTPLCGLTLQTLNECLNDFNEAFKGGIYSGAVNICPSAAQSPTDSTGPSAGPTNVPARRRSSASVMAASALLVGVAALL